jgi:hypothetical protein
VYYVRIKFEHPEHPGGADEYHAALRLARKIAEENRGLTVEVAEDKVWGSTRANEGVDYGS